MLARWISRPVHPKGKTLTGVVLQCNSTNQSGSGFDQRLSRIEILKFQSNQIFSPAVRIYLTSRARFLVCQAFLPLPLHSVSITTKMAAHVHRFTGATPCIPSHLELLPWIRSPAAKPREGSLSSLNVAIEALNLAKEISCISPAKAVLGSVTVLLTMTRECHLTLSCDYELRVYIYPGLHGQRSRLGRSRASLR